MTNHACGHRDVGCSPAAQAGRHPHSTGPEIRRTTAPIRAPTISTLLLAIGLAGCGPADDVSQSDEEAARVTDDAAAVLTRGQQDERHADDALAVMARPPHNRLTEAERAEGWRLLFDGRSLDGWRGLGMDGVPEGHWRVEDGMIRKVASGDVPTAADGQPLEGGDIMTVDAFTDFELSFEWRVAPGANSGVKYNVSEALSMSMEPERAALGYEYQVLDDDLHPDAANGPNRTAAGLYDLIGPGPTKRTAPVGEFNQGRVVFQGGHGEHWLNGEKVLEFDLGTPEFDALFEVSKYAPIEGFYEAKDGHVVLQDHGDDVWYRNVKIRELPHPEKE